MNLYGHSVIGSEINNYPRYLLIHTPDLPFSIVSFWLRAGSRFDPPGKEGLAHFVEHVLMKRTKKIPDKVKRLKYIERKGIRYNSLTTKDPLFYFCIQESQETITAFDLLLEGFLNSLITERDVEKEKKVVIDEIRKTGGSSASPIWRLANEGLWTGTGFEHKVLGSEKTVKRFSMVDVKEFQNSYYSLGNLSVVILSPRKYDLKQAESKLERLGKNEKTHLSKENNINPQKNILKKGKGKTVHIAISFLTKTHKTDEEIDSLRFIRSYLAGNWTSRLVQKLRIEKSFTYWVNGYIKDYPDAGFIRFIFSVQKQNLNEALRIFSKEICRLKTTKLSKKQIEQHIRIPKINAILASRSAEGILRYYGWNFLVYERIPQLLQDDLKTLNSIAPKNILSVAREQLNFPLVAAIGDITVLG